MRNFEFFRVQFFFFFRRAHPAPLPSLPVYLLSLSLSFSLSPSLSLVLALCISWPHSAGGAQACGLLSGRTHLRVVVVCGKRSQPRTPAVCPTDARSNREKMQEVSGRSAAASAATRVHQSTERSANSFILHIATAAAAPRLWDADEDLECFVDYVVYTFLCSAKAPRDVRRSHRITDMVT